MNMGLDLLTEYPDEDDTEGWNRLYRERAACERRGYFPSTFPEIPECSACDRSGDGRFEDSQPYAVTLFRGAWLCDDCLRSALGTGTLMCCSSPLCNASDSYRGGFYDRDGKAQVRGLPTGWAVDAGGTFTCPRCAPRVLDPTDPDSPWTPCFACERDRERKPEERYRVMRVGESPHYYCEAHYPFEDPYGAPGWAACEDSFAEYLERFRIEKVTEEENRRQGGTLAGLLGWFYVVAPTTSDGPYVRAYFVHEADAHAWRVATASARFWRVGGTA